VDCLYENDARAAFETAAGAGSMDPMVLVSGMASVSKNVSFGITGSTTYLNVWSTECGRTCVADTQQPYILARTVSTLDHITKGRFAWNVVTSYSDSAAKAMGKTKATSHDRRYEEAHEYMDLVYSYDNTTPHRQISLTSFLVFGKGLGKMARRCSIQAEGSRTTMTKPIE